MSILKLEEIKSLQGTGNTVITFDSSDRAVFAQPPLTAVPAFRAYLSADQSVTTSTFNLVELDTVSFDTNSFFNTSTHIYTPQIAGYYFFRSMNYCAGTNVVTALAGIYKNDNAYNYNILRGITTSSGLSVECSSFVYLNGSTDYVSLYGYITGTSPVLKYFGLEATCILEGFLVRAGAA